MTFGIKKMIDTFAMRSFIVYHVWNLSNTFKSLKNKGSREFKKLTSSLSFHGNRTSQRLPFSSFFEMRSPKNGTYTKNSNVDSRSVAPWPTILQTVYNKSTGKALFKTCRHFVDYVDQEEAKWRIRQMMFSYLHDPNFESTGEDTENHLFFCLMLSDFIEQFFGSLKPSNSIS
jgi:hypothetical protein